jgi:hypothetical protein
VYYMICTQRRDRQGRTRKNNTGRGSRAAIMAASSLPRNTLRAHGTNQQSITSCRRYFMST